MSTLKEKRFNLKTHLLRETCERNESLTFSAKPFYSSYTIFVYYSEQLSLPAVIAVIESKTSPVASKLRLCPKVRIANYRQTKAAVSEIHAKCACQKTLNVQSHF